MKRTCWGTRATSSIIKSGQKDTEASIVSLLRQCRNKGPSPEAGRLTLEMWQMIKDDRAFSLLHQELPQILVLCFP